MRRVGPGSRRRSCARSGRPRRGRAEQAGMAGDAPQRPGVLVVHLADQQPAAPRVDLGRRRAFAPGRRAADSAARPSRAAPRRPGTRPRASTPYTSSRMKPSRMKPRSLYTDAERGAYSSGSVEIARSNSARPRQSRKNGRWAVSPEACSSRSVTETAARSAPSPVGQPARQRRIRIEQPAGRRRASPAWSSR